MKILGSKSGGKWTRLDVEVVNSLHHSFYKALSPSKHRALYKLHNHLQTEFNEIWQAINNEIE